MKWITREHPHVDLDGIRLLHYPDDQAQRQTSYPLVDALYAYCEEKVAKV